MTITMRETLQVFGDIAIKLARTPLGVLALFIVLVYAITGILAFSDTFTDTERLLLVGFLVLFPFVCWVLSCGWSPSTAISSIIPVKDSKRKSRQQSGLQ